MIRLSPRVIQGAAKQLAQIHQIVREGGCLAGCFPTFSTATGHVNLKKDFLLPGGSLLHHSASFKSHLSIEKIYPNSDPDYLKTNRECPEEKIDEFTGFIPIEKLKISYMKSSGPGGQNVNKVNSKVEVRFHLQSATWIPQAVRTKLGETELGRITKEGYFVVRSEATRKQIMNQADCMDKIRHLVFKAQEASRPRELSTEGKQLKEARVAKAKAGILREKRKESQKRKAMTASSSHPNF